MTPAEKELCEQLLGKFARKWQTLNRSQWKYQFREKTIVRFVDEVQLRENEIPLFLEFLSSDDCVSTLSVYDQTLTGTWKPVRAWLEIANKSVGAVHSVRLYHALTTDLASTSDGPYVTEDGCRWKVEITYHWREDSAPTCPASSSGVHYSISGLNRDQDTGKYSYAIEKRTRVQQDIAEYTEERTVYRDTKEAVHLGVKESDVATTGEQASCGAGVITRRSLSKNEDCTSDVKNVKTVDNAVQEASQTTSVTLTGKTVVTTNRNMPSKASTAGLDIGESVENTKTESGLWNQTIKTFVRSALSWISGHCRSTKFLHTHSETVNQGSDPGFTHVVEASNGVIREKSVHRTSDGTYNVTDATTTETQAIGSSERTSVTLTGKTVVIVNRNMPTKASTNDLEIGESVENTMTDGGLWNQTIKTFVRSALNWVSGTCRNTFTTHTHSETVNQGQDPGFTDAAEASNGVIHEKHVSKTSDGTYNVTESTTTEKPSPSHSERTSMSLDGKTIVTVNRNMPNKASTENLQIGESVENARTEGGLWNQTIKRFVVSATNVIAKSCRKAIYAHSHSQTVNQGSDPGFDHVSEASNGVITEKSVRRTANGTYDVTESTTTEQPVENSERTVRKTLRGTIVSVSSKNQQNAPSEANLDIGDSVSYSKTAGGLYDVHKTTHSTTSAGVISESCENTKYAHHHSSIENKPDREQAETAFVNGMLVSKRVSATDNGTYDVQTSTTTPKPVVNKYEWSDGRGRHGVLKYKNYAVTREPPSDADVRRVEDSVNEFGLHDGVASWSYAPVVWKTLFIGGRLEGATFKEYQTLTRRDGKMYCRYRTIRRTMRYGTLDGYVMDAKNASSFAENSGEILKISNIAPVDKGGNFIWSIDVILNPWNEWIRHLHSHHHSVGRK